MDKKETVEQEAKTLLAKLEIDCELEVVEDDGSFHIQINTAEDASILIGRYGETLQSIQRVLEAILYTTFADKIKLVVNINDYREKQKERLEKIAQNVVEKVREEKREQSLPSFSSYERKIIHEYISENFDDITSYSQGEGLDRKLFINLKEDNQ